MKYAKSIIFIFILSIVFISRYSFAAMEDFYYQDNIVIKTYFAPPQQKFVNLSVAKIAVSPQEKKAWDDECDEGSIYIEENQGDAYYCRKAGEDMKWWLWGSNVWESTLNDSEDFYEIRLKNPGNEVAYNSGEDAKIGIGTKTPKFTLTVGSPSGPDIADGGIMAFGQQGKGNILSVTGEGTRFFWYPRRSAIRAGGLDIDGDVFWDDSMLYPNIGDYSAAFGKDVKASGDGSFAAGYLAEAEGTNSVALGKNVKAQGSVSMAFGANTISQNDNQIVFGSYNASIDTARYSSPLLVVGNGTYSDSSNAVVTLQDGSLGLRQKESGLVPFGDFPVKGSMHVLGDIVFLEGASPDIVFNVSDENDVDDMRIISEEGKLKFQSIGVYVKTEGNSIAGAQNILVVAADKVGIDTDTPTEVLDVKGDIYAEGGGSYDIRAERSFILEGKASDPSGCEDGEIYYNSSAGELKGCIGGSWLAFSVEVSKPPGPAPK